ncbi:penicillin-binding protein activator [Rhodobaculum claviforme]|uniref:Penicillin-binding protein activator n=1 Tax=Rhodobaculum claviforme TaxID=1549854 RepID=A0A934TKX6_9RHOB|nr:penicillin-binding protein activator [Rhodobaculum claviforme]MBK5927685.1 penicillin-binding protein activator [Rhodobaculum claviforme]
MLAVLASLRKAILPSLSRGASPLRRAALAVAALGLVAACEPVSMSGPAAPAVDRDRPVQVALLVPAGSGQTGDAALARSLENAARLAVADLGATRIDLRIYDTAGNAGQAAQQATRAVNEGAQVILGPVFADSARAVGTALAGTGVPVLSFSNNPRAASGNVFILGPTFDNTAQRLVAHAVSQDKRRFLAVAERNDSGEIGREAIARAAQRAGGVMAGAETFDFSQQGVVDAVPRIAEAARNGGADAIFFTSNTAGALPLLVQLLPENRTGPGQFQYIGLTRWDIPNAILELPGVQGAWFALPDPGLTQRFNARYAAANGRDPHPIAGLAYDGIAAIGALVRSGRSDALSRAALTQAQGFAGVAGVFRLLPDGTNERSLAVAEIRNQQVVVIAPAPRSFAGPGL